LRPTLLILAAGLGSRYGGLKQLDGIGPNGEIMMDYSIHDALKAGFGNIVLLVQEQMVPILTQRYLIKQNLPLTFVIQEKRIVRSHQVYENDKPWGTAHALWCTRKKIKNNFLLINADDFYGKNSFALAYKHLIQFNYPCSIVFPILKTLSENGRVNRAEIQIENGFMIDSVEREKIYKSPRGIYYLNEKGESIELSQNSWVSMNMWGFTTAIFDFLEEDLDAFIIDWQANHKLEYQLPNVVNSMIKKAKSSIKVIPTNEDWIGITYKEDKQQTTLRLKQLHESGIYESK